MRAIYPSLKKEFYLLLWSYFHIVCVGVENRIQLWSGCYLAGILGLF